MYRVNWEEKIATIHSAQVKNESVSIADQADDYTSEELTRHQYILMYSILMGVATYVYIHRTFAFFAMCLRASINLHDKIFRGITRATMFFFNNNPSGRILNRFSKDISSIDTILPPALIDCLAVSRIEINCDLLFIFFFLALQCFLEFLAIVVIVVIVNYWLLIPTLVMSCLFYIIRHCFISTSRSVKRIESIS